MTPAWNPPVFPQVLGCFDSTRGEALKGIKMQGDLPFLPVFDAAQRFMVPESWIKEQIRNGKIRAGKIGKKTFVSVAGVKRAIYRAVIFGGSR